ncbi:MAG TPA: YgiQ family radical SAM protein [Bacteroidales bacterium]|nr:YgiQ family radical SAM protein [Bacteroidales bacterium]
MKNENLFNASWLPTTGKEAEFLGWDELDVILFSGDAYIDHPSFGPAVIARLIEDEGFKVAVIPQPNWKDDLRDFRKLGKPKYFFGVTAGNMDSMVNHYTAAKRLRSDDAYTPGGKAGFRPDYPTIVYSGILKKLYPDVPVVIGGIEASMRRLTHYDYWKDKVEPSVLFSSGADLLVYGMGEQPLREILRLLKKGVPFSALKTIPQTAIIVSADDHVPERKGWKDLILNSFEKCVSDKKLFSDNFVTFEKESNRIEAARLIEPVERKKIIINPQFPPMTETEADQTYDLPFTYKPHPRYNKKGAIPAYEMIKFSVNIHRGCFGGCSFCAIAAHQGKQIVSRSEESVLKEVRKLTELPDFKGYLTDLGGPSANMYRMHGKDMKLCKTCPRPSCIWPSVCKNLDINHKALTNLYRKVDKTGGIKKSFIGSGVRYDLLFAEWNKNAGSDEREYLDELVSRHVSGRLKVAPEHTAGQVLYEMRKAPFELFRKLKKRFDDIRKKYGLNYELIPYFISSHPGCTNEDMRTLAEEMKSLGIKPEQVQDFTPTPMTLATTMYYTGFDPYTGKKVYVARSIEEKRRQKEYFFWYKKGEGATAQRHKGARAQGQKGSTAQGHKGDTAQRRNGVAAQRHKGKKY